ncbi:MAG: aspartate aminotransferase family protein, partial [Robiginitomaculum sp.]|nr:aspartate aminotransferase family protein [Robiginitomaculum sp.]
MTHHILFPSPQKRKDLNAKLDIYIDDSLKRISRANVTPTDDLGEFLADLKSMDFDQTQDLDTLLQLTIKHMENGAVQMTNPKYFGLFNPAPSYPAEAADRIASALNPQICVWSHAPVAVEIESHVIGQICQRVGFENSFGGHFTSGGSEANATAVLCALTAHEPNYAQTGARGFTGQPRIYVSAESHLAWIKIAHQNGIGRQAVCLVPTDGQGRMDAQALDKTISQDKTSGNIPIMIAATAGTTNAGMVDPLNACADIAKAHNMWFHVDAAWGGALIASQRERGVLCGIGLADSITIDAHKWFATTMGAGMYLTSRPEILPETFRVSTSYMPSNDEDVDLYVNSMMWSRRFIGLRLFLSLASVGWQGYSDHVEHGIDLIDTLNAEMKRCGWTVVNASR